MRARAAANDIFRASRSRRQGRVTVRACSISALAIPESLHCFISGGGTLSTGKRLMPLAFFLSLERLDKQWYFT